MKNLRTLVLVILVLWVADFCLAQPTGTFDEWGKVTLADMKTTECSFEKDADAVALLNLGQIYYAGLNGGWYVSGTYRVGTAYYQRIKILTEKGVGRANFKIYYGGGEVISEINASCWNLDATGKMVKTKLLPADIHDSKTGQMAFSIPDAKKGSVYELTYQRYRYLTYTLPDWYFSISIPCVKSSVSVGFIDAINYYTLLSVSNPAFTKTSRDYMSNIPVPPGFGKGSLPGTVVTYTALNVASVTDEPFMNSRSNYCDKISFQLNGYSNPLKSKPNMISSWLDFNRSMLNRSEFGGNLSGNPIPKTDWQDIINDKMTDKEKAKAIFDFVQKNLKWDGVVSRVPKYDNPHTWKEKTGSSAEINVLLINMLRQVDINAYPMIVGSRAGGYLNRNYPMLDQLQKVIVMVELGDDKVVLDASNRFLPFGLIDFSQLNNYGYVIKSEQDSYMYQMFDISSNAENSFITATLSDQNNISGQVESVFDNYTAMAYRKIKNEDGSSKINDALKERMPNLNIESVTDTADEVKNRYTRKVKFSHQLASDNEGKLYVSLPDLYGEVTNPFDNKARVSDVDFGYKQKSYTVLDLTIPANYEVESLIKRSRIITPDTSITVLFDSQLEGDKLSIRLKLEYKKSLYTVAEYPDFYEFQKEYYKLVQQPVILKRKS